jgi:hypothetical protein
MKHYILDEQNSNPMTIKNGGNLLRFISNDCGFDYFSNDPIPNLAINLEVYSKSKVEDVMAGFNSFKGLIISEKLKNLFSNFALPPFKLYPLTLKHKNNTYNNYYWVHVLLLPDNPSPISFEKTQFFKSSDIGEPQMSSPVYVKNFEDARLKKVSIYAGGELYLNKEALKFDLFAFRGIPTKCYLISERLKQVLIKDQITGITIKEASWVFEE